jgi:uncharacterized membrane protein
MQHWKSKGQSLFELFFKYTRATFDRGEFVFASGWPLWLLVVLIVAGAAAFAVSLVKYRRALAPVKSIAMGILQTAVWACVLVMLWRPALVSQNLRPQENTVAVLVDASASMAYEDDGSSRFAQATALLDDEILPDLTATLGVQTFVFAEQPVEVEGLGEVTADGAVTHLGDSLLNVLRGANVGGLAAVVVLSDGVDNSADFDAAAIAEIASFGVPIHTVGIGSEVLADDVELEDVSIAAQGPAGSTASAQVSIRHGAGGLAQLKVYDGDAIVAAESVQLPDRPGVTTRRIDLDVGAAGVRDLRFTVDALPGETNIINNTQLRPVEVPEQRRSILYIEGEPRWEYKFMRRAIGEDSPMRLASLLRTTPNKFYRQGIEAPDELVDGFPTEESALFKYDALIVGSYEAAALTDAQQEMIRDFVSRRGGSLLMLGGRRGLADGGWGASVVAEVLPAQLPQLEGPSFARSPAKVVPTEIGLRSLMTRFAADDAQNRAAWNALPEVADYQLLGDIKPGADVLLEVVVPDGIKPLLVHQRYGLGNVYILATGGTWRWQMQMPHEDMHHETFWRQMFQALTTGAGQRMTLSAAKTFYADDRNIALRAELKDPTFAPRADADVTLRVMHASGAEETVAMAPIPGQPGVYGAEFDAVLPGVYRFEASAAEEDGTTLNSSGVAVRREDGVAEYFHLQQNRALLERIAAATGGRYFTAADVGDLAEAISFSEAGIVERQLLELWNMPALFLLLLLLKSGEWLLRLRWGRL